jgi:hypothetical protein
MSKPRPATAADGDVAYWKIQKEHSRVEVAPVMIAPPSVLVAIILPLGREPAPSEARHHSGGQVGRAIMLTEGEVEDMIDALRRALAASKQGQSS